MQIKNGQHIDHRSRAATYVYVGCVCVCVFVSMVAAVKQTVWTLKHIQLQRIRGFSQRRAKNTTHTTGVPQYLYYICIIIIIFLHEWLTVHRLVWSVKCEGAARLRHRARSRWHVVCVCTAQVKCEQ